MADARAAGSSAPAALRRVLVVDDDPGVRTVLGRALARRDYEVFLCERAADALAQLGRGPAVDLLVSDVTMPGMSGLELAALVRARYPRLPILFVTALTLTAEVLRDPLVDVAYKPVQIIELRRRVAGLIDRARLSGGGPTSADAMQPAHGDSLGSVPEGFEFVVPRLPEQHP